jgi:hypothetical protein
MIAVAKVNPMKNSLFENSLAALVLSAISVLPTVSHAGLFSHEEKVQWAEVPPIVQNTITAHADNGKVEKIEKEVKNKMTIYEASVKTSTSLRLKIEVSEDGKLLELRYKGKEEKEIAWDQVPTIVQQAFAANAQNGKIRRDEVEIEARDGIAIYEGIADTPDEGKIKMKISIDGKLLEFTRDED